MLGLWHWGIYSDRRMRVYGGHILYQNDAIELAFLLWYPAGSAIFWYILVPFSSMINCNLNVPFVRGFPSYVSWHRRVNGLESPLLFPKSQSIPWNPNLCPLKPGCIHIHSQFMIFSWKKNNSSENWLANLPETIFFDRSQTHGFPQISRWFSQQNPCFRTPPPQDSPKWWPSWSLLQHPSWRGHRLEAAAKTEPHWAAELATAKGVLWLRLQCWKPEK